MIGYIRDPQTWNTVKVVNVTTYELPYEVAQGENGSVIISDNLDDDYTCYMISIEDSTEIYRISSQQSESQNRTTLTLFDWKSILDNNAAKVSKVNTSSGIVGRLFLSYAFLNDTKIRTRFAPSDFTFDMEPFKDRIDSIGIPISELKVLGEVENYYIYDRANILRVLSKYGIQTEAKIIGKTLSIVISNIDNSEHGVVFNDGHSELISANFNNDFATGVGIFMPNANNYFYIDENGVMSQDRNSQAKGSFGGVWIDSGSPYYTAVEFFAKNSNDTKIEFCSDKEYHIGQTVNLFLNRGIVQLAISKVLKKSNDRRFFYTCGDSPVTASEKIASNTISYTTRLPQNPKKGQLFLLEE